MIRNFFLSAIRNLLRNKTFTILNTGGLILGVGCAIVLISYIRFETSYNKHLTNYDNIYRVVLDIPYENNMMKTSTVPHPFGDMIRKQVTSLDKVTRLFVQGDVQLSVREGEEWRHFMEDVVAYGDTELLEIFDFEWLAGSPNLTDPNSIVISASIAKKYFNVEHSYHTLLNETLRIDDQHDLMIRGVYADLPEQSDFLFPVVANYESQEGVNDYYGEGKIWARLNGGTMCVVTLPPGQDARAMEVEITEAYDVHSHYEGSMCVLQPIGELHYDTEYGSVTGQAFPEMATWTLGIIAALLIIASSINFVNLSTAKATNRAKEVGIRKVLGSSKRQLIFQHMSETLIIVLVSMIGALATAELLFQWIEPIIDHRLTLTKLSGSWLSLMVGGLTIVITLLTGLYPSLVISGFKPIEALKTSLGSVKSKGNLSLRRLLVIVQFTISLALLIGTLVAYMQNNFLRNKEMGFAQEGIISIVLPEINQQKNQVLKNELLGLPSVSNASLHLGSPVSRVNNTGNVIYKGESGGEEGFSIDYKDVDEDYLDLFDLKLVAGENLKKGSPSEHILVNESFVRKMGLTDPYSAIGEHVTTGGSSQFTIVGVVSDFNARNLREDIRPVLMYYNEDYFYELAIRLASTSSESISTTLADLEGLWKEVYPQYVLNYDFVDEAIQAAYEREESMSTLFQLFSFIAIVIGCLGLYGLIDFIAIKKTKEIGIRKVLGATIGSILRLFLKEMVVMVTIAIVIAGPLMYFVMSKWLDFYAYRVPLGISVFLTAFGVIAAIALLTMGYRSYRASLLNPVDTLKDE